MSSPVEEGRRSSLPLLSNGNNGNGGVEEDAGCEDSTVLSDDDDKRSWLDNDTEIEDERIQFDEANGRFGFAIRSDTKQVHVHPSEQFTNDDASPFNFTTIVDYSWETQYSPGRLIATHISSLYIAYVVKVGGGDTGAVRVIDMKSKERVLMKGVKGLIKDAEFVHEMDDIILGFIDEYGTFYIYNIDKALDTGKLTAHPIIIVTLDESPIGMESRRFIWCKPMPEDPPSRKECAYYFAVVQNDTIYVGNLMQLVKDRQEGPHKFQEIKDQFICIDRHSAGVTDASFSPDGTAVATCAKDGTVKFFQIYVKEGAAAQFFHSLTPHDGSPIDRIGFLESHALHQDRESDDENEISQYWNFMITAAENCTELKLFNCKSWECLQTLKFLTPPLSQWKLELSFSGRYLMTTDIHRKAMYLLHLECTEARTRFDWIQEFPMPWTTLGFNITSAGRIHVSDAVAKGFRPAIMGDLGSYKESDVLNLIEINVIQPTSMQQGSVALKSPKVFCRSRSRTRSPRRISFNPSIESASIQTPKIETTTKPVPAKNPNLTGMLVGEQQGQGCVTSATATSDPAVTVLEQNANQNQFKGTEELEKLAKLTQSQTLRIEELEQQAKLTQSQFSRIEELLERISDVESSHPSREEFGSLIMSAVSQSLEPSKLNVAHEIDRLTHVVEAKLAQNINEIMEPDQIWQTLTNNFQAIAKNAFDSTWNDVFKKSVVPLCQTAVQEMLSQANETFKRGTSEYLTGVDTVLESERRREYMEELMAQQMSSTLDALGGVVRQIEDSMTQELSRSFQELQRFLEVSAVPRNLNPAATISESLSGQSISDAQENKRRVMEMARNGDVRGSFTLASSLRDTDILMQLCKTYNATILSDLNLSSSVHLSIMQLLASDLLEDAEVKIDYLQMSLMCFDMEDVKSVEGVTHLIPAYQAAVNRFEGRNPNNPLLPRIKFLQMAFGKPPQNPQGS